jgi:hypothetical protein
MSMTELYVMKDDNQALARLRTHQVRYRPSWRIELESGC